MCIRDRPLSYWLSTQWLNDFAFQVELNPWYLLGAGLAALLISWMTVGVQTIRAALENPVTALKSE